MGRLAICMANGCEEIEGLTVVDIIRRAGIDIDMLTINDDLTVTGSHNIEFKADKLIGDISWGDYDGIILPGGMPGTTNLEADSRVQEGLKTCYRDGKLVAAICAAPGILGRNGIAKGKKVTCYPGCEEPFTAEQYTTDKPVVVEGNLITSRGMGTAIDFALAILAYFKDEEAADDMAVKIIFK